MLFWALEEIETVQLGMELVEGYVVTAADFGSTLLHAAEFAGGRLDGRQQIEAQRLADEFRTGAVFSFADLLELGRDRRRQRDSEGGCGAHGGGDEIRPGRDECYPVLLYNTGG